MPLMNGQTQDVRGFALSEYRNSGFVTDPLIMTTMVRFADWKLIVWHGAPACGTKRDGELYNLAEDPGELHNLYHKPEYLAQRRKMKAVMLDAMSEAEDRTAPRTRQW